MPGVERSIEGVAVTKPAPVAVALDAPDLETAARWAALVTPHVSTVKVGLELYLRYGPQVVATVQLPGKLPPHQLVRVVAPSPV